METESSKPQETTPAPAASTPPAAAAPAPAAPAPAVPQGPIPQTNGKTPGGWNRFAGYDREAAKNKKQDRRESRGRR